MNGPDDQRSRFAELAMELMGADAARSFIDRVWENASPQVRAQLADAVVLEAKRVIEGRDTLRWAIEALISKRVVEMAEVEFATVDLSTLHVEVQTRMQEELPKLVARVCDTVMTQAKDKLLAEIGYTARALR